ncbi:tRNA(ANN) t(6)A37 threonylcarbamoyladenosine modification protein [Candidatus Portiera aleyrodidarum]|uniref:tRNA(ANN) t(6)A37 threonylcarbamoyladenosine modification protein n=1 Tax=Candidatus Portiera aleyrodidarum TaxID=91844 RepID=A0A6S6S540_9GAMM|nr:peptidase [Candidatus Portiera aleyrodidarum]CAA3710134.1 tRNA(ANN) t(6)A37 threonylcarbamoyladenosine modification protein [Candidatus Portiera aleyrodidarum]
MKVVLSLDYSYTNYSISLYQLKRTKIIKIIGFYRNNNYKNNILFFLYLKNILNKNKITLSQIKYIIYGKTIGDIKNIKIIKCISKGIAYILNIPIIKISKLKALAFGAWFDFNHSYIISCMKISKFFYNIGVFELKLSEDDFHIPITLSKEKKINIKNKQIINNNDIKLYKFNKFIFTGKGVLFLNRLNLNGFIIKTLETERMPESTYIIRLALAKRIM